MVYALFRDDCDGVGATVIEFDEEPTIACVTEVLLNYHPQELSFQAARELCRNIPFGQSHIDSEESIRYRLEKI